MAEKNKLEVQLETAKKAELAAGNKLLGMYNSNIESWRDREYTWVVDPLDGTRDFIDKTGHFGILIGLTFNGFPVLGINYYPAKDVFYYAVINEGAYKKQGHNVQRISASSTSEVESMIMVKGRSQKHSNLLDKIIEAEKLKMPLIVGTIALKICKVTEGDADFFLCTSSPQSYFHLWDVCSSQPIIQEAGGMLTDLNGNTLSYRPYDEPKVEKSILISNGKNHGQILEMIKKYV